MAVRDNSNITQLAQLFEPILIALTLEDFKVKRKLESFTAYSGVDLDNNIYKYENPYQKFAPPKTKSMIAFVPNL